MIYIMVCMSTQPAWKDIDFVRETENGQVIFFTAKHRLKYETRCFDYFHIVLIT